MKQLMSYFNAACFAFTFSSIIYMLFRIAGIFPLLNERMSIALFVISISITALFYAVHQLPVEHPLLLHIAEAGCVIFVMMIAGKVFHLFPLTPYSITMALISRIAVYISVMLLLFLNNKADEQKINESIKRRRQNCG